MDGRLALYSGAVFTGVLIAGTLIVRPGFGASGSESPAEAAASPAAVATEPVANSVGQADSAAVFVAPAPSRDRHDDRKGDGDHKGGEHDDEDDD